MIFVTVGTQLPFDRMVGAVDDWASGSDEEIFAQTGVTERLFSNITSVPFLPPSEARRRFEQASCIVAHAGTGTIFAALTLRKPLIVMPRRASLGEHRNEHQLATARHFEKKGLITVAWDEHQLTAMLEGIGEIAVGPEISGAASDELLSAVRRFLRG